MAITNDQYDQLKIDKLRHYLEDMAAKAQSRSYEIFVDSLKVVPRTEDVKQFDSYEYYMNENTEKIRILIYSSSVSPRNDQYCFYVQQHKGGKGLNGLGEIEGMIQEKLEARDREHEMALLRTQLAEAKQELEETEDYAEKLQQELDEVKANKFKLGNINIGELASIALEGMIRRNPQLLTKLPGGEALAGIIEQDNEEKQKFIASPSAETEVSFQKASDENKLNPQHLQYIPVLQQLDAAFDQEQLKLVMQVLGKFSEDPVHLTTVAELLNI
jgi:dihydroneopterin aldolase